MDHPPCNKINQSIKDAIITHPNHYSFKQKQKIIWPCQRIIGLQYYIKMEIHEPQNRDYFCSSCVLAFNTNEDYKIHYKSDLHRYNIKRKMVKLPPVTPQQFSTKLHESKKQQELKFQCNECRKTFASDKTLNQHVSSKKHNPHAIIEEKQKSAKLPTPFEKNYKKCFFCQKVSRDLQQNEEHMYSVHSFFIAQRQFCKNPTGLIEYLQEKVQVGNMCITCQNKKAKDFQSADAVRKHMSDKGHSVMKTDEGFQEYEKYYDFSALFEAKLKEQVKIIPGIEFQKVKVLVDDEQAANEEQDWEDEDEDKEDDQDEGQWQSQEQIQEKDDEEQCQIKEENKKPKVKVYQIMRPTLTATDQLLLPNGKLLGHRKYRHIYKQVLRQPSWFTKQFRQIAGAPSSMSNALIDRRNLMQLLRREDLIGKKIINEKKHALRCGMTNNGLMHYFRCQNPK